LNVLLNLPCLIDDRPTVRGNLIDVSFDNLKLKTKQHPNLHARKDMNKLLEDIIRFVCRHEGTSEDAETIKPLNIEKSRARQKLLREEQILKEIFKILEPFTEGDNGEPPLVPLVDIKDNKQQYYKKMLRLCYRFVSYQLKG